MSFIALTTFDLALAAMLVMLLAGLTLWMQLRLARSLLVAATRTVVQLLLIGLVLKALFASAHPGWIGLVALVMLAVAGREVMARQQRRFTGAWGFGLGALSMFVSAFSITLLALLVVIEADPWYAPQYSVPLLGMMFGNTMNGIALGTDRLTQTAWQQRAVIEGRLMMGQTSLAAIGDIRRESIRTGLIPIINAMAVAGVVSLPGMMTGQILAGVPPVDAVYYQILIMFMIAAGTGFGTVAAVSLGARRLFDRRDRLRLERLRRGR